MWPFSTHGGSLNPCGAILLWCKTCCSTLNHHLTHFSVCTAEIDRPLSFFSTVICNYFSLKHFICKSHSNCLWITSVFVCLQGFHFINISIQTFESQSNIQIQMYCTMICCRMPHLCSFGKSLAFTLCHNGLKCRDIFMNVWFRPPGDLSAGDLGLGAVPGREQEFRQGLDLAVRYAKALDCRRYYCASYTVFMLLFSMHVLAGIYKWPNMSGLLHCFLDTAACTPRLVDYMQDL